jgi:TPR repeat protein
LEVHRAIETESAVDRARLPLLPVYVERDHDRQLRRTVREAIGGASRLVVLVGGSSTGKTRACWEAVQMLPDDWRLWHPIDPGRPDAALAELRDVAPRTVVWLNEIQHYLLTPTSDLGERVAAGLRELLRDGRRGPVLVLGTVWPEYWTALTTTPRPSEPDPHSQARNLLAGQALPTPSAFIDGDLAAVQEKAATDPRLASAVDHAEQGQITQYLAGAPALLDRYRTAPDAARALIEAAMDARRLGHGPALPHDLLAAAAGGYLSDEQWDLLPENWLEQALAYCTASPGGTRGPLTLLRPRNARTVPPQPLYRLADYLEQHSRRTRRTTRVPIGLWHSLIDCAAPVGLTKLAQSANNRGLLRIATCLYANAAEAGETDALSLGAQLLWKAERTAEAIVWCRRAADAGDVSAVRRTAEMLEKTGRSEEAITWLRARAEAGDTTALSQMGEMLKRLGRTDEAVVWCRRAAEAGDNHALWRVADLQEKAGRADEAIIWLRSRAEAGDAAALLLADEMLERTGRTEEAVTGLQARAEAGDTDALWRAANLLESTGRSAEAIAWLQARADAGDPQALRRAVHMLRKADRGEEAAAWLRACAETSGSPSTRRRIAGLLLEVGRIDEVSADTQSRAADTPMELEPGSIEEAMAWYQRAADTGDTSAMREAAELLEELQRIEEAVAWYQRAAEAGGSPAIRRRIADLLLETGRSDQAIIWYKRAAEAGDNYALWRATDLLEEQGHRDEAVTWLQARAEAGDTRAARRAVNLLEKAGRLEEAITWLRARAEAGDTSGLLQAAEILVKAGRSYESVVWYRRAAEAGDVLAAQRAADHLESAGRAEEALTWLRARAGAGDTRAAWRAATTLVSAGRLEEAIVLYQRAAEAGETRALWRVGNILEQVGRKEERTRLWRYGWEPDGSIAEHWDVPLPDAGAGPA